ncbi:MAG: prepilin-type N-terminal cleavage/methylation domain-containing protein [Acidobacteriota bacterium]
MQSKNLGKARVAGFSLFELLIAMTITLMILSVASAILAGSFKIRSRENQRTDALADAQRGLNLITREVANSGYGLTDNGIVGADSGLTSIRVRANLNASERETTSNSASDKDEDIKFLLYTESGASYIVRLDVNVAAQEMVLANRVDALNIRYYPDRVYYTVGACDITNPVDSAGNPISEVTSKSDAKYVVISVCVTLPAVGAPNSGGYQPPSSVQLVSDATLRNSDLVNY